MAQDPCHHWWTTVSLPVYPSKNNAACPKSKAPDAAPKAQHRHTASFEMQPLSFAIATRKMREQGPSCKQQRRSGPPVPRWTLSSGKQTPIDTGPSLETLDTPATLSNHGRSGRVAAASACVGDATVHSCGGCRRVIASRGTKPCSCMQRNIVCKPHSALEPSTQCGSRHS